MSIEEMLLIASGVYIVWSFRIFNLKDQEKNKLVRKIDELESKVTHLSTTTVPEYDWHPF